MADDKLTFLLFGAFGLAASLTVQLIGETGEPVGAPLAVTESALGGGHYRSTMAGAAGVYAAVVLYDGDTPIPLQGDSAFVWDGTNILYPLDATETQAAAAAAITATPANLGTNAPANWINADSIATNAVTKIQNGLSTYDGSDTSGTATLLSRLSSTRASYIDKLNVSGTLANTDNASTFRADLTSLSSAVALIPGYFTELQEYGDDNWIAAPVDLSGIQSNIGLLLSKNMLTLNKPVTHSPTQIVIGNDEVIIDLVVDDNTDTVTGTRTT